MRAVIDAAPLLIEGFATTVALAVLSMALATVLGAAAAALRIGGGKAGRALAGLYTTLMRGIPDLVTMLIVYFGVQRLVNLATRALDAERIEVSTMFSGVLAIGIVYGAYLAETFRGAHGAIPRGQIEAARAHGLGRARMFRRIVAPQVMRLALPGYSNVWQVLLKATALVSVIGLDDLVGLAARIGRRERDPFTFLFVVLLAYLLVAAVSEWGFRRAERRLGAAYR